MTATIRDIARAAGLSVTTVSHALSGRGRVAAAPRERVEQIAGSLGYVANVHAQRLVMGRSRTLAVQVVGFAAAGDDPRVLLPDDQYFMDLLHGAITAAAAREYQLVLTSHESEPERIHPLAIDGALIVDPLGNEPLATVFSKRGLPIVTTGRSVSGATTFPSVDSDHGSIALRAVEHFVAMGYSRPAVVATAPTRSYVAEIIAAYERWSRERGIDPIVLVLPEPSNGATGGAATDRLLAGDDRPDAIYATHDRLALGLLLQAQRMGIAVPAQLGLASAMDSDALQWVEPQITAAELNAREVGVAAAQLLIDLVEGCDPSAARVLVASEVLPRASTARRARLT